jgi:hypothetical protein
MQSLNKHATPRNSHYLYIYKLLLSLILVELAAVANMPHILYLIQRLSENQGF